MQNRLSAEVKLFIVQALARYLGPTQVRDEVKAEFDVECSIPQICFYDPTKGSPAKKLDKHLREVFAETREVFRKTTREHAIADIGYRVGRLQRMSERAEKMKNYPLAAALLEQAAKDIGGSFTNKRDVVVTDDREYAREKFNRWLAANPTVPKEEALEYLSKWNPEIDQYKDELARGMDSQLTN